MDDDRDYLLNTADLYVSKNGRRLGSERDSLVLQISDELSPMARMHGHLLLRILDFLEPSDLARSARVCRRWTVLAEKHSIWSKVSACLLKFAWLH